MLVKFFIPLFLGFLLLSLTTFSNQSWLTWTLGSSGAFCLLIALLYSCYVFVQIIKKNVHFRQNMMLHLEQKLWITFGLASVFLCLYLIFIFLAPSFFNKELFFQGFRLGLEHPANFFYWGLFIFVLNTLLIYLVRMILKFLFVKRN